MNHSKAFWKVRNEYAEELKALWHKGYTGEGLWGRGLNLANGAWETNLMADTEPLPEHLCGGTYRSSRKRKQKPRPSYKEQQAKRIAKKFGTSGVALGADDEVKAKLEKGKKLPGKPRVAGSVRGRELRAAAALARFETRRPEAETTAESPGEGSEKESDFDEEGSSATGETEAVDINGKKLLGGKGQGMVKVCEDDDQDDADAKNEMAELWGIDHRQNKSKIEGSAPVEEGQRSVSGPSRPQTNSIVKIESDDETASDG